MGTGPTLNGRPVGRQRHQIVAHSRDLLDQVLARRVVLAVYRVRVVGHRRISWILGAVSPYHSPRCPQASSRPACLRPPTARRRGPIGCTRSSTTATGSWPGAILSASDSSPDAANGGCEPPQGALVPRASSTARSYAATSVALLPSICCADAATRRRRSSTASTCWSSTASTCVGSPLRCARPR
jgi:hypothetical protein